MKETIEKINETKGRFFEKIKEIDKLLARLLKKKRERAQISKIRNEKEEQMKPKVCWRKEILTIRAEINEIETEKTIEKISETKSWFSER